MVSPDFTVFPVLHSSRLTLRRLELADVDAVFKLRSDPELMKYIPRPLTKTLDDARQHILTIAEIEAKNEGINWAISLKDDVSNMLGTIGLYRLDINNCRAEIGYMLLSEHHKKGYISESVNTILKFSFDKFKFHSLQALIDPENIASEQVLIKAGFKKEAHLRDHEYFEGKFLDTVIYSILGSEYLNLKK